MASNSTSNSKDPTLNKNTAGIPHYISTIYYDILCLSRTIEELGCAIFSDGRSFQLNERTAFEAFVHKVKRVISLQEFIDIMSGKLKLYNDDNGPNKNK